jgi:hypothetical protein
MDAQIYMKIFFLTIKYTAAGNGFVCERVNERRRLARRCCLVSTSVLCVRWIKLYMYILKRVCAVSQQATSHYFLGAATPRATIIFALFRVSEGVDFSFNIFCAVLCHYHWLEHARCLLVFMVQLVISVYILSCEPIYLPL